MFFRLELKDPSAVIQGDPECGVEMYKSKYRKRPGVLYITDMVRPVVDSRAVRLQELACRHACSTERDVFQRPAGGCESREDGDDVRLNGSKADRWH